MIDPDTSLIWLQSVSNGESVSIKEPDNWEGSEYNKWDEGDIQMKVSWNSLLLEINKWPSEMTPELI